jgi:hypothetical protein
MFFSSTVMYSRGFFGSHISSKARESTSGIVSTKLYSAGIAEGATGSCVNPFDVFGVSAVLALLKVSQADIKNNRLKQHK